MLRHSEILPMLLNSFYYTQYFLVITFTLQNTKQHIYLLLQSIRTHRIYVIKATLEISFVEPGSHRPPSRQTRSVAKDDFDLSSSLQPPEKQDYRPAPPRQYWGAEPRRAEPRPSCMLGKQSIC